MTSLPCTLLVESKRMTMMRTVFTKGPFTNYVTQFFQIFDHLPTYGYTIAMYTQAKKIAFVTFHEPPTHLNCVSDVVTFFKLGRPIK